MLFFFVAICGNATLYVDIFMTDPSKYSSSERTAGKSLPRVSIGQKIAVTFLLVLVFAVANIAIVKSHLDDFNDVVATVNIAGKLRMLSQRLAFRTVGLSVGATAGAPHILQDIHTLNRNTQVLRTGGIVDGHEIRPLGVAYESAMTSVEQAWFTYRADLQRAVERYAPEKGDVAEEALIDPTRQNVLIMGGATNMLKVSEDLMAVIVSHSEKRQKQALFSMYMLLLADVAVLFAAFFLARRYMVQPLRELAEHSRQLRQGNYQARVHYTSTDEIGDLARSFNYSAQQIGQLVSDLEAEQDQLRQSSAMFMGLAANTMVGIYIVQAFSFRFVNQQMASLLGYATPEDMMRTAVLDMFFEEDRPAIKDMTRRRLSGEKLEERFERRVIRKDKQIVFMEFYSSVVTLDGLPTMMGVAVDVTQRKEAEASSRLATLVYESSSEAMVVTDEHAVIVTVNPAFTAVTGYPLNEVIGRKISILSSGRQSKEFYQAMWRTINETGRWEGDIWNRRKNGEEFAERLSINTSYNEDGSVRFRIGLFSDITKKKQTEALIWKQANYDHLTGLPNRQLFHDRLEQAIKRSKRSKLPVALVFLDLDFFKEVNDTLGHDKGDELLRQVSKRLTKSLRATDTVARLGGDEFIMIIGEVKDTSVVHRLAQDTLKALANPYLLGRDPASISASMGVTFYPADADDGQELLKNADLAMYAAKNFGRNQYAFFTEDMRKLAHEKRQLTRDLWDALEQNQFVLYYQPIVNLRTGRVSKAEALVRWVHPEYGVIGPNEFIPFAEDNGIIVGIGDWVYQEATRQVAFWRNTYQENFQVSVNVSPVQFMANGLNQANWLQHLRTLNLPGDSVVVEITERLLMDVDSDVIDKLLAFRDAGVGVAIDDFGTGYSSLSYLKRFDIDFIKIDQSFVRNLSPNSDDLSLCEAIIVMAHRLGLKVIAEGIETPEQYRLLEAAGCDYGQGYIFSRPVPAHEFVQCWQPESFTPDLSLEAS